MAVPCPLLRAGSWSWLWEEQRSDGRVWGQGGVQEQPQPGVQGGPRVLTLSWGSFVCCSSSLRLTLGSLCGSIRHLHGDQTLLQDTPREGLSRGVGRALLGSDFPRSMAKCQAAASGCKTSPILSAKDLRREEFPKMPREDKWLWGSGFTAPSQASSRGAWGAGGRARAQPCVVGQDAAVESRGERSAADPRRQLWKELGAGHWCCPGREPPSRGCSGAHMEATPRC